MKRAFSRRPRARASAPRMGATPQVEALRVPKLIAIMARLRVFFFFFFNLAKCFSCENFGCIFGMFQSVFLFSDPNCGCEPWLSTPGSFQFGAQLNEELLGISISTVWLGLVGHIGTKVGQSSL